MLLWKLRIFQEHLTAFTYAELLRTAKEKGSIDWLTPHWFFEDEIKTSIEEIRNLVRKVKGGCGDSESRRKRSTVHKQSSNRTDNKREEKALPC